jgi:hypothetical protein
VEDGDFRLRTWKDLEAVEACFTVLPQYFVEKLMRIKNELRIGMLVAGNTE